MVSLVTRSAPVSPDDCRLLGASLGAGAVSGTSSISPTSDASEAVKLTIVTPLEGLISMNSFFTRDSDASGRGRLLGAIQARRLFCTMYLR